MAAALCNSPDDMTWLKQKFKFQSEALAMANKRIRKLEKALAAKPNEAIIMANENQCMTLMMRTCEMILADPSNSDSQKVLYVASTIARTRGEMLENSLK